MYKWVSDILPLLSVFPELKWPLVVLFYITIFFYILKILRTETVQETWKELKDFLCSSNRLILKKKKEFFEFSESPYTYPRIKLAGYVLEMFYGYFMAISFFVSILCFFFPIIFESLANNTGDASIFTNPLKILILFVALAFHVLAIRCFFSCGEKARYKFSNERRKLKE